MNPVLPHSALQLRSLLSPVGQMEVSLVREPLPQPAAGEVLVRVEAAPINPSDLGLLLGPAEIAGARITANEQGPGLVAPVRAEAMVSLQPRVGRSLPVGNEGAGTVVAAGTSDTAQRLLGRTVAVMAGGMYAQYRCVAAAECLVLPEGTTAAQAASCFINPLTALGMVETMRTEGHKAIVQTAAASNLGQMLLRICLKDGIPLVNVVRSAQQVQLLRAQGASHVCDSSAADFSRQLTQAIAETGATIAFDAIGGGEMGGLILSCMEAAIRGRPDEAFSRYGSDVFKQLYVCGSLDPRPIVLPRDIGSAWGAAGWLLFRFLQHTPDNVVQRLKARVAAELTTTFTSHYTQTVSLMEAVSPEVLSACARRGTGSKFLIAPWKDAAPS